MNFTATVITGLGKGKDLDCPTLNLEMSEVPQLEPGVYACFARMGQGGIRLPAVMHYGSRPTLDASDSCEVHILDHRIDLPPHSVTVEPVEKLREVQNFGSAEKLARQLQQDREQARAMLFVPC